MKIAKVSPILIKGKNSIVSNNELCTTDFIVI